MLASDVRLAVHSLESASTRLGRQLDSESALYQASYFHQRPLIALRFGELLASETKS